MNSTWTLDGWKIKYEGFLYQFRNKISFSKGLHILIDGYEIEKEKNELKSNNLQEKFAVIEVNGRVRVP